MCVLLLNNNDAQPQWHALKMCTSNNPQMIGTRFITRSLRGNNRGGYNIPSSSSTTSHPPPKSERVSSPAPVPTPTPTPTPIPTPTPTLALASPPVLPGSALAFGTPPASPASIGSSEA